MRQMTSPFCLNHMFKFCMQLGISILLLFFCFCIVAEETAVAVSGPEKNLAIDLGGGVKMEFVLIRPGSFLMGSDKGGDDEKPAHKVTFSKPFYIGKCEVTQEQWQMVTGVNPSTFPGAKNPVEQVSWKDCQAFIEKLNNKVSGREFSLPTEAQWEYACRAGSITDFCCGDADGDLGEYAWIIGNSGNTTHPVGQKKPNAWGLHDMHGNVWEWCQDAYHGSYEGAPADGSAWILAGSDRICRGGCWSRGPSGCRSSLRFFFTQDNRCNYLGFRLVLGSEK